jgi:hypothetical protein
VENPPADGTIIRPTNNDPAAAAGATPADTTTKINVTASLATDGGGVDATKSTKNIRAPSPPPDDGAMEAIARQAATSTKNNPAPSPQTDDGAVVMGATQTDTTMKINAAASLATDYGGVDATKSTKNI